MAITRKGTVFDVGKLEPGREIEFEYPARNRLGIPLEYVRRRIHVLEVINLFCTPVLAADFLDRPLVRRGSVLIVGQDIELDREGRFYLEAMRGRGRLPNYQLALIDIDVPQEIVEWIGDPYPPDPEHRLAMAEAIRLFSEAASLEGLPLELVAFPVLEGTHANQGVRSQKARPGGPPTLLPGSRYRPRGFKNFRHTG